MKKRLLSSVAAVFCGLLSAGAQSTITIDVLKTLVDSGVTSFEEDVRLEGFVISDPKSANRGIAHPPVWTQAGSTWTGRTVYMQSADGKHGVCLLFGSSGQAGKMKRWSKAVVKLQGAQIERLSDPVRYCVKGLTDKSIVRITPGSASDVPVKKRSIGELRDSDIYTYITLKDCEFVHKDGSYTDVYEGFSVRTKVNDKCIPTSRMMFTWARLLSDGKSAIWMFVNLNCPWRRSGSGVPAGHGEIDGIVVSEDFPRYGAPGSMGRFQILPMTEEEIRINGKSRWTPVCEWTWADGERDARLMPDTGKGEISLSFDAKLSRVDEPNNESAQEGNKPSFGMKTNGALRITAPSSSWWNWERDEGQAVTVHFSTAGISGKSLMFSFSFSGGGHPKGHIRSNPLNEMDANYAFAFPVYWKVQYSRDGENWKDTGEEYTMRALPWFWRNNVEGVEHYPTSLEAAAPGFTEHVVFLPRTLLGCKDVYVRIMPSRKQISTLAMECPDQKALRPTSAHECFVNFGSITVRSSK